jgi:acyl-[acyl carrier protein]--UDP-N-acetylglucosamine O-acyltransferase
MDKFTPTVPLSIVPPGAGEGFNKLQLNYSNSLALDVSNNLGVNTVGFLTPTYGDLGLRANASGNSYVVVKTISQPMTCLSSLNVSGGSIFSNNVTVNGILNVSGITIFSNSNNVLNISGNTTFYNTTMNGFLNVSGFTTLSNNTTISSSLNISGFTILSNTTSIFGTLNISGYTNLSNKTTLLSSLNVSGRTTIGTDTYNYSDSVVEMYKNFNIRKIPIVATSTSYDRVELKVGLGTGSSTLSMEEGYDINLINSIGNVALNCTNFTGQTAINLNAYQTRVQNNLNVSNDLSVSNNLSVQGKITCANLGQRVPMFFTTSRTFQLNGTNYSCYDIDLRLYTNSILLDGFNIRQFRIRTWVSSTDFEHPNMYQNNYSVFMSDRNGLSIFAHGGPYENFYFNVPVMDQFLYRNSFNILMYCSRQGSKKIYCIIEDLL